MSINDSHTNRYVYLKLVLVTMAWGGTFIATRIAAQTFGPFTGAAYRYSLYGIMMVSRR